MNKPNPELLKTVRDGLARYNEARKTTFNDIHKEEKIAGEINRALWSALRPDAVKYLESMVGHKIRYIKKDGDVIILSVKSLKFEKWEVSLLGEGVRYTDRPSFPLSELSCATIKYDSLNEAPEILKVADTSTVEDLVADVEKMRAAQLEAAAKKINDKYDGVIASIRNMKEPEEVEDFTSCFDPDPLDEITYFRWSDLVREFGTEEDKKMLEQVPVDVLEEDNCPIGAATLEAD